MAIWAGLDMRGKLTKRSVEAVEFVGKPEGEVVPRNLIGRSFGERRTGGVGAGASVLTHL